jgi:hypothetical protein
MMMMMMVFGVESELECVVVDGGLGIFTRVVTYSLDPSPFCSERVAIHCGRRGNRVGMNGSDSGWP